ncbi:hypothetical protein K505DRAFT_336301 [Melanomma pulvis-pyrius CBS 109.77]|uniref:Uncharacterized protein n=1 Tax=Melanomma pulvis-pyrius CBS 109.77 TaxID=1314802 RepID=A0A6A6XEW8_9PLEO|nr:hypothetical protein K505DRAFT_336301 [Melanomma pulvis-pyrius CBS 109.77]
MHLPLVTYLSTILLFLSLAVATHIERRNQFEILPRQAPTAFTTARTANTEFAPPQTVTPPDPSATGTQTTTHEANTEIIPATTTGTPPPLITTDSRSANTQAVGPFTVSSGLAVPTGVVRLEAVFGVAVVGIAGII